MGPPVEKMARRPPWVWMGGAAAMVWSVERERSRFSCTEREREKDGEIVGGNSAYSTTAFARSTVASWKQETPISTAHLPRQKLIAPHTKGVPEPLFPEKGFFFDSCPLSPQLATEPPQLFPSSRPALYNERDTSGPR